MKIKKSWIVIMTAAVAMLTACSRDLAFDEKEAPQAQPGGEAGQSESDLVPVTFTLSEKVDFTRAATNIVTFNSGEPIKVCVKPNGAESYTPYTYTTTAAGQTGVTLTAPSTPPYFPLAAPHTVRAYAYYPASVSTDGTTETTFTVLADQTSPDNYKASDLMYAADRTITKGSSAGTELVMAHLMAQLHLNVSAVGLSVHRVLVHAKPSVTFTPATGAVALTEAEATDIVAATAAGHAYICIPEQPINTVTVKVETGAQDETATTATFTFTSEASFTAGQTHPLNLTLTAAQLGMTTAISDWNGQQSVTYVPTGDLTIDDIPAQTYKGSAFTYSDLSSHIVVRKNGTPLTYDTDYDVQVLNNTNAGTAVVVAIGKGTNAGSVAVATFTINKADVTLSTAPTKKTGLTFNGSAQALVNAGSASGGTLKYKLGDGEYGNSVPTAVNANTTGYSVTYYVEGDANHNDTEETTISGITVAKKGIAAGDITLASQSLTYNGSSQTRNVSTVAGLSSEGNWSVANNSQTNAGSYELTVTMLETCQNYTGNAKASWSIARKAVTNWSISPTSLTIKDSGGSSDEKTGIITVSFGSGNTDHGTVSVSGQGTACTTSVSGETITVTGATAGSTTLTVTVGDGTNYTYSGDKNCSLTVDASDPGVTLASSTVGMAVGSNGKAYATNATLPDGVTKVAVVGYKSGSSGYAIALVNSTSQTWSEITNSGDNKNIDCTLAEDKRGSVPTAPTGTTWKILTKDNYSKLFQAMGSTDYFYDYYLDDTIYYYDSNVNNKITAHSGTALSGNYWSSDYGYYPIGRFVGAFYFSSSEWRADTTNNSYNVRPVLVW